MLEAVGHGRQPGITHEYRGRVFESRFLPKALLVFVVEDGLVDAVVDTIAGTARTGTSPATGSSGRRLSPASGTTARDASQEVGA